MTPRASSRQYGAYRPLNAGTKYTPPLSCESHCSSDDAEDGINFSCFTSHSTHAPAKGTLPSNA
jgi:hypothetical protein